MLMQLRHIAAFFDHLGQTELSDEAFWWVWSIMLNRFALTLAFVAHLRE
jgi:hypothetical protein